MKAIMLRWQFIREARELEGALVDAMHTIKLLAQAADSLMGEVCNSGPATDWGQVNSALCAGEKLFQKFKFPKPASSHAAGNPAPQS